MIEVYVLFVLALIWLIIAVFNDMKSSEIPNWLNFSLIIFALSFRFFYSLFELGEFSFFYSGLIGFLIFFVIGNIFYYAHMFAGGDMKLMIALGAILPIYPSFVENVWIFLLFILLFLVVGAIYSLIGSFYLGIRNFSRLKKEIKKQFKIKRRTILVFLFFSLVLLVLGFFIEGFFILGIILFVFSYLFIYLIAVDEACMVKKVEPSLLTPGDWLYRDVKIGKKIIKANWDGLSKKNIELLKKKNKKVWIRYGIQFAPTFLISFILLFIIVMFNLVGEVLNWVGF